jgi:hypothetical protein
MYPFKQGVAFSRVRRRSRTKHERCAEVTPASHAPNLELDGCFIHSHSFLSKIHGDGGHLSVRRSNHTP